MHPEVKDGPDWWEGEPVTWRRYLTEQIMATGVAWWLAREAVASTALEHPEAPWDTVRTRREWLAQDLDL